MRASVPARRLDVRRWPSTVWLPVALAVLATASACSDDDKPGTTTPTATVRSVTLTSNPSTLPVQGGEVEITATVTNSNGANMAGQQVTFTTTRGTLNPATPVTSDANGQAKVKLTTSESATVRASTGGVNSSDLNLSVRQAATLTVTLDPAEPVATQPFKINVVAKRGGADVTGALFLNYGNGEGLEAGTINGTRTIEYTYKTQGGFNLIVSVQESDGSSTRETSRVNVKEAPRTGGNGLDDIDAKAVRWFADCNVSGWPVEERVLDVSISSSEICVDYTGRGTKGTFDIGIPVDATVWVFAQFNGVWYGATWDHLRPGTFCKAENANSLGSEQIRIPPMDSSWVPRRGDRVGFMVSGGLARRECDPQQVWRTNIQLITWP